MRIKGQRVEEIRWIETDRLAVKVRVEAVVPIDDPSEPCFEPATLRFLDEVRQHADAYDLAWLENNGEIFIRQSAQAS